MILDATASYRRMWRGMYQCVIFIDVRREVKPDILASNEFMPFRAEIFEKVVYDPPHLIRNSPIKKGTLMATYAKKFSYWKKKTDFYKNLVAVNKEVKRVLKPNGIFFMKHSESPDNLITTRTVMHLLDNFKILRNRTQKTVGFGNSIVRYVTMTSKE